jgi:hypothetical protein
MYSTRDICHLICHFCRNRVINYVFNIAISTAVAKYSNVPKEYKIMGIYICDSVMVCSLFFGLIASNLVANGGEALNLCPVDVISPFYVFVV